MTARWAPTARLRWVQREEGPPEPVGVNHPTLSMPRKKRVLQQWWETDPDPAAALMEALTGVDAPAVTFEKEMQVAGEWRDVPEVHA